MTKVILVNWNKKNIKKLKKENIKKVKTDKDTASLILRKFLNE